jgi:hypothetical protein
MTMVSDEQDLLDQLCETDLKSVVIVVDGFEPECLSALEASVTGNLFRRMQ